MLKEMITNPVNEIDNTLCDTMGSKVVIHYINFLLSIWDKPNLYQSAIDEIKLFWMKHFTHCNHMFIAWFVKDTTAGEKDLRSGSISNTNENKCKQSRMVVTNILVKNIDSLYVFILLMFKMKRYLNAYKVIEFVCKYKQRYHVKYKWIQDTLIYSCYGNYTFRNDWCLQIDLIIQAIKHTKGFEFNTTSTSKLPFSIKPNSNLSPLCGFDQDSLPLIFALFEMNCRPLSDSPCPQLTVSSTVLRQIRTSLFFFCMRFVNKNNYNHGFDTLYWLQFGMISIGIQSLLWINCSKFNLDNNDIFDCKKIEKYLNRFVISYIESGLKFPMILNKKISRVARLCLILAYFVVGEKQKLMNILNNNYNQISNSDNIVSCDRWYNIKQVKELCRNDHNQNIRTLLFSMWMDKLQVQSNSRSHKSDSTSKCHQQLICDVLSRKVPNQAHHHNTGKKFVQWKNSILKRDQH